MRRAERVVFIEPVEDERTSGVAGEIVCDGGSHRSGAHDEMIVFSGPVSHDFCEPTRVISPPYRPVFEVLAPSLVPSPTGMIVKVMALLRALQSLLATTGAVLASSWAYAELGEIDESFRGMDRYADGDVPAP